MARRASSTSFGAKAGNRRNTTTPGTGAPPETFRARMRLLASREKTVKNVESILDDASHRQFSKVLEFAADRGYGKPVRAEDIVERVEKSLAVIRKHTSPEQAQAIAAELRPIWV